MIDNFEDTILNTIYPDQLLTINGIKFTHREIDVIACIFHTRGSSKIASLLSISSRTVETHTANIMRKMDTNSREGIIDFLEKFNHIDLIERHYRSLLLQTNFKKKLQEVHTILKNQNILIYLFVNSQSGDTQHFLNLLTLHLKACGIKTVIYEEDTKQYLSNCQDRDEATVQPHFFYVVTDSLIRNHSLNRKHIESLPTNVLSTKKPLQTKVTYISIDINQSDLPSDFLKESFVCFNDSTNYYASFFNLLKIAINNNKLREVHSSFISQNESSLTQVDQDVSSQKMSSTPIAQRMLSKRHISNMMFVCSLFIAALFLGMYLIKDNKITGISKVDAKNSRSIRSDLIVPSQRRFLTRPNIIAQIDDGLKGKEGIQTVAIIGVGGAGKSTIARRYALAQNYKVVWEVNATNRETLLLSFERLAYALCKSEEEKRILQVIQDIKNNLERSDKVLLFVKNKLKSNPNWLLIFDNLEKFTSIRKYFPSDSTVWGNGKIIITTTNSNTHNNSLINSYIYIGELSNKEKLNLFKKIMCKDNENFDEIKQSQAQEFLNDIPPFPLDVSMAADYLKATNTPTEKYLKRLKENNKDFETMQVDVVNEASGYAKTRYNIISLSIMQLIDTHKDFKDLLLFISFLDYKNIPTALLARYKGDTVVDSFLYNLKQYSFITSESAYNSVSTFSLHKITQEIILSYLTRVLSLKDNNPLLKSVGDTFESYIVEALDNEDFLKMKLLVPHCEAFLTHENILPELTKISIGGTLGCINYFLRHYIKSKQLLEDNLKRLSEHNSHEAERIARLTVYLGNIYRYIGDLEKAKRLLTQSLTFYNKNPNGFGRARVLGYLGVVYRSLGDYQTSKNILKQGLEIYENHCPNSIGHAWILAHLGNIYMIYGEYEKSKSLLEQSLALYKKQSEDYVGVAWVLGYLGALHILIDNLDEAQRLLEQSLNITRKYFSDDHIFIATQAASLGNVFALKGDHQKAKNVLIHSLNIYEKNYGKNHIETARVLRLLGEAYALEGDLDTAEDLLNESLLIFQQKDYPEGYKSLESLADVTLKRAAQSATEQDPKQEKEFMLQAINYLNKSLEILRDSFDENSPDIRKVNDKLNNIKIK